MFGPGQTIKHCWSNISNLVYNKCLTVLPRQKTLLSNNDVIAMQKHERLVAKKRCKLLQVVKHKRNVWQAILERRPNDQTLLDTWKPKISNNCGVMFLKKFKNIFWTSSVFGHGKTVKLFAWQAILDTGSTMFDRLARVLNFYSK